MPTSIIAGADRPQRELLPAARITLPRKITQLDILLGLLLGCVYLRTLLPGVGYSGDTAGFQFIGNILGIPHPTGYPGYTLLNHVFVRYFPFGSHAYRANLLSAVVAVSACLMLQHLLRRIGVTAGTAFGVALTYGLSRSFWSQAVVAEVYTLNILFIVIVLDRFVSWQKSHHRIDLLAACAFYALSFGNHLSMIFLLPGLAAFVWCVDRRQLGDIRLLLMIAGLILLGASQYLYLGIRSRDPFLVYSEMFNGGFRDVLTYVTGGPFQSRMLSFSAGDVVRYRIPLFLKLLAKELLVLVPVFLVGVFSLRNRALHVMLGLTFLGAALYGLGYNVDDVWVFFLPCYVVCFIYIAFGVDRLRTMLANWKPIAIQAAMASIVLGFLAVNYPRVDRSHDVADDNAVLGAIRAADRNAVILSPNQITSEFFWYYLIGEGWEAKANIHLVHHVQAGGILGYLKYHRPVFLPEERRFLPLDLHVYDWRASHRQQLESAGLTLVRTNADLYSVIAQ